MIGTHQDVNNSILVGSFFLCDYNSISYWHIPAHKRCFFERRAGYQAMIGEECDEVVERTESVHPKYDHILAVITLF